MSIQSYGNARAEIDAFAHGIHPRALTDGGLAAALPALTRRAGVPVQLTISTGRLPLAIEAAVYFLCSDALTNVAKYSGAAHVAVDVNQSKRRITATVADDGVGGADPSRGSGLRGLTDRFDALGGWLSIESRRGVGTRLLATLPVEVDDVASPLPTSHVLVDCRPPHHASSVTGAWRPSDLRSDATTRSRGRAGAFRRTSKVSRERRSEGDPAWSP